MFPIADETLSFSEIADYWSREIRPPASDLELLRVLESAWWRGEIVGETALTRLKLIRFLFGHAPDLDLIFMIGDEPGPPEIEDTADGSVEVDLRPRLTVPSADPATWNDTNCATAYEALAKAQRLITDPTVGPALRGIGLSHQEFFNWLAACGYHSPTFWRTVRADADAQGTAHPEDTGGPKPSKSPSGRKPGFDWGKIEVFVVKQLDKNGHWDDDPEDGWRSQSDLVALVQQDCLKNYGREPADSTVKEHLRTMIKRWREQSDGN
jgi:hypothetical protein